MISFFFPPATFDFDKGASLIFLSVLWISAFLTVWCARRSNFSPFSTERAVAQMNYAYLVSVSFTLYPSSYATLMLTTSLPTVSSGEQREKPLECLLCASLLQQREKYRKGQKKEHGGGGEGEVTRLRSQE